jgi:hypothetical protein
MEWINKIFEITQNIPNITRNIKGIFWWEIGQYCNNLRAPKIAVSVCFRFQS